MNGTRLSALKDRSSVRLNGISKIISSPKNTTPGKSSKLSLKKLEKDTPSGAAMPNALTKIPKVSEISTKWFTANAQTQ